jgi:uncharacterized protein YjiK
MIRFSHRDFLHLLMALMLVSTACTTGCKGQGESHVAGYNLAKPGHRMQLPKRLREISGLAVSSDGRLFAHDDERGIVYQLDAMTGSILKSFYLGRTLVNDDFEGIAIADTRFFLVSSDGNIYEFPEGVDGGRVEYRVYRTTLSKSNNVEGLCFDPDTGTLLLACKGNPGKGLKRSRSVYSFSLDTHTMLPQPRFVFARDRIEKNTRGNSFQPSAIERHPRTGNFFLLAAQGQSLLEVAPDGRIITQHTFAKGMHPQAEGLTFLPNGDMLISDEGESRGMLSHYFWKAR